MGEKTAMQDNGFWYIMELTEEEKRELLVMWKGRAVHNGTDK